MMPKASRRISPVHTARPFDPTQPGQEGFTTHFDGPTWQSYSFYTTGRCRLEPGRRKRYFRLSFDRVKLDCALCRQRCDAAKRAPKNLQVVVEATVRSIKHPFPAAKLPVRGLFRVTCMVVDSAAMTNIWRIQRHLTIGLQPDRLLERHRPACDSAYGSRFGSLLAHLVRPSAFTR